MMPCFASMDIAAAFPSLTRERLWETLRRRGIRGACLQLLQCCYRVPLAFLELGGARRPLILAESGVAQGCALSGALWGLIFDPSIEGIKLELAALGRGLFSACADDLGVVLAALGDLRVLRPRLQAARLHAELRLHAKKCILVPT
eukprot:4180749-Pyramimonas_sp.AAC.1